MKVINFSGGKSSALMTILSYEKGDLVLFTDTGREVPETYKFISDFANNENIPVVITRHEKSFSELFQSQNILPNQNLRLCTIQMKIKTAKRYLRKNFEFRNYEWLIGFRSDEQKRIKSYSTGVNYLTPKFPLNELGITKEYVNEYWSQKDYTLEIPPILGNCNLCFLKGKNAIINIMRKYPDYAKEWIEDELKTGHTYIKGISYSQMLQMSKVDLFADLEEIESAFNCSCTN